MPASECLRAILTARSGSVSCDFAVEESGWYRGDLLLDGMSFQVERYCADEAGIRAELNSWAAWLETREGVPEPILLMERMIQTAQLFTLRAEEDTTEANGVCVALCRFLAAATDGVYQIDERGFFDADGNLLVEE